MDTPTSLTAAERQAALERLDGADLDFVDAMLWRQKLTDAEFDGYIPPPVEPTPPLPPPPTSLEIAERRLLDGVRELFERLERGESPARNPFERRDIKELERLAQSDPVQARAVCLACIEDGALTGAEAEAGLCVTSPPDGLGMSADEYARAVEESLHWARFDAQRKETE